MFLYGTEQRLKALQEVTVQLPNRLKLKLPNSFIKCLWSIQMQLHQMVNILKSPKEGKKLKNIKYSNELWGFHLKYINKSVIQKKHLNISKRYNKASNESYANDIDDIYDSLYTVSFPLSNFFEKIQLNRDSEESKLSGVFRFEDGQRIKE